MAEKPITMRIDEFREKFVEIMNNANLPAWILLYVIEPYIKQLQVFDEAARAKDREDYETALKEENAEK